MSKECEEICACGKRANHDIYRYDGTEEHLCCVCYIKRGGLPADWHPDCMRAVGRTAELVEWETA